MQINALTYSQLVSDFQTYPKLQKWSNVHLRPTKTFNDARVEYMHALHLDRTTGMFFGHICGTNAFELEYTVDQNANIKVVTGNTGLTKQQEFNLVDRDFAGFVKRAKDDEKPRNGFQDNSRKGKYYLRRSNSPSLSLAANAAISKSVITSGFAQNCLSWHIRIREGVR